MSKMKNNIILDLQAKYLETGDRKALEELYVNILRLSYYLLRYGSHYPLTLEEKDTIVKDIASDIIMRLMETGEPVIRSNPISYLGRSILYASTPTWKNKTRHMSLDVIGDDVCPEGTRDSLEEQVMCNDFTDRMNVFLDQRLSCVPDDDARAVLRDAFDECLLLGKHYSKYVYKLQTKYLKEEFVSIMEDFHVFLKKCQ